MDELPAMDELHAMDTTPEQETAMPLVEETSQEYLGRWNRLVSTTNWEKGRIIAAWREALLDAGAPAAECTDDAWSRRVGNVSPQHVGRLRRVWERFNRVQSQYAGLFWSHFQAALDWLDAEMWLEGAVQNGWSVAAMRRQRWETLGAPADLKPRDEDVVQADFDEDVDSADEKDSANAISDSLGVVHPAEAAADRGDDEPAPFDDGDAIAASLAAATIEPVRPFEHLAQLPSDLNEAFELFKLAILHHRISAWQEVPCRDVLAALEALKQLATAPTDE
jgi:hypothetical protein